MSEKNKKIRNTYLIILTIVTCICVFAGLMFHLYNWSKWFDWSPYGDSVESKDVIEAEESAVMEPFDSIDISMYVGDVRIVYGDEYNVTTNGFTAKLMPKYSIDNRHTLVIKQKEGLRWRFGWHNFNNNLACQLIVTVPRGTELKTIACELNMGNLEIASVKAASVALDADMGSIELQGVDFATLAVEANMGSISAKNSKITTAAYEADMGSIELEGSFNAVTAECSMGAIEIRCNNINDVKLDLDCDMGDIELNGKSVGSSYKNYEL